MSLFKFASLAHPEKYGYAYDPSAWSNSETNACFRQFETYGDRLIQHSGDWSVTFDYLTDYLASLAVAMLANDELADAATYIVTRHPRAEEIAFAASVVWKESDASYGKRRFYSVELRKIAGSAREHDKRFSEVSRYQDGTRDSIYRLITSQYAGGLERYQNAEAVREWAGEQKKHVEYGAGFPEWLGGDRHKESQLRSALRACRLIAEALNNRRMAESDLENYKAALARAAEPTAFNQDVQFTRATAEEITEAIN